MSRSHPLWRAMQPYRAQQGLVVLGFALACVTLLAQIGLLAISGWFIAAMGAAGAIGASINYFTPAAIIRALAMLRTAGRYGERLVTHDTTLRSTGNWRSWFYGELEARAPAGISDLHSAEMFSRFRADIDRLERFFLQSLLPVAVSVLTMTVVLGALLWLDAWLAGGMLMLLLIAGIVIPWMQTHLARAAQHELARVQHQLRQELADLFQGRGEILIYGQSAARLQMEDHHSGAIATQEKRIYAAESVAQGILVLCIGLGVLLGITRGFMLVADAQIPATYLAMLPLLCLGCFDTVAALPTALLGIPTASDAARRLYAILDRPLPRQGSGDVPSDAPWQLSCSIPVMPGRLRRAVSFSLHAGESLVIAGASGVGKSSVLQWITGMLPLPAEAQIRIHDTPQASIDPDQWCRQFAVAEQRPVLFMGTLRENLRLAAPTASDAALHDACRLAHFPLTEYAQGLDYPLDEQGANLSGGQRRRLAIARALLRPAPCLILDEPTEGLDAPLAHSMMQAILAHTKNQGQAVILITHDPALQATAARLVAL